VPNIYTAQLQKWLGGTKDISQLPSDVSNYFKGKTKSQIASDVINMVATNPGLASDQMVLGAVQLYNKNYKEGFDNVLAGAMQFSPSLGMVAYHGSPHKFDKFDMSKIGTGEGAQVYGHGLYFAENKSVADEYRKALSKDNKPKTVVDKILLSEYKKTGNFEASVDEAMRAYRASPSERARYRKHLIESGPPTKLDADGNIYHVDIPDEHIDKMLDWDSDIRSSKFKPILKNIEKDYPDLHKDILLEKKRKESRGGSFTGGDLYDILSKAKGGQYVDRVFASQYLKEKGIPGIKYLDQGSRGAGKGSRNFVLFDDEIPKVIKRE
jgi:hypothetical protein